MADEIKLKAPTVEQQVVVNIQGEEKLRSFADTLDKMSKGRNLQKYWKEQEVLIKDVVEAYKKFGRVANEDTASELLKTANALKAMSNSDISSLSPELNNISSVLQKAEGVAGHLVDAFSINAFKDAFSAFETLRAYGVDIQKLFTHFGVSSDVGELQKNVRSLEGEVEKLTRRLTNAKNANEELRNEFENFKSGSGFADKLDELDNLKSEMSYLREQAEETFRQFLKLNNITEDGYDRDGFYDDNRFKEYFQNIQSGYISASDAIRQFKTKYSYLLEDSFKSNNDTFGLEQLQAFSNKLDSIFRQVEETSTKINDIISNGVITKSVENLSMDSSLSDSQRSIFGNILQDEESLKSITALFQKLIEESNKTSKVDLFNDEQLQQVLSIFDKIEGHLSSLRSIISDVGDGEEFSPLMKVLNSLNTTLLDLKTTIGSLDDGKIRSVAQNLQLINKKVGKSQFNVSIKEDNSLDTMQQQEKANQFLEKQYNTWIKRYESVLSIFNKDNIDPFVGLISDSEIGQMYNYDADALRKLYGKESISGLDNFREKIERITEALRLFRTMATNNLGADDPLFNELNKLFSKSIPKNISTEYLNEKLREIYDIKRTSNSSEEKAKNLLEQINSHNDKINKIDENNKVNDLQAVLDVLNNINKALTELVISATTFSDKFKEGFNITASVEEIDKLTNRVKELEDELAKIKLNPVSVDKSNISSENVNAENELKLLQEKKKILSSLKEEYDEEEISEMTQIKSYQEILELVTKIRDLKSDMTATKGKMSGARQINDSNLAKQYEDEASSIRKEISSLEDAIPLLIAFEDLTKQTLTGFKTDDELNKFALELYQCLVNLRGELGLINTEDFSKITSEINSLKDSVIKIPEKKKIEIELEYKPMTTNGELAYRGIAGKDGNYLNVSNDDGAVWWTSQKDLSQTRYTRNGTGSEFSGNLKAKNLFEFTSASTNWQKATYLGDGIDELSVKITDLYNKIEVLKSRKEELIKTSQIESQEYKDVAIELGSLEAQYEAISNSKSNMYGTHMPNDWVRIAKQNGYDGLAIHGIDDDTGNIATSYAVWAKEQIENVKLVAESEEEFIKIHNEFLESTSTTPPTSNSPIKDVFQGGTTSAEKLEEEIKNIDSATEKASESAKEYRKILSQVGEFDIDSKVSAMYKRNDGQLESWTWRAKKDDEGNILYDQDGKIDYDEPTITVISKYEQLEKIIVKADNELRNLQKDLSEIKAYDPTASTTNIETKISDQKEYIRLLEQTIKAISQSDEYLLDEQQIIEARNKAAREYALTTGAKQEKTDAKQSASDEKKRLANIEQVNRALNRQQITIDAIEKTYNKTTNPDLDREVSNQQDLAELAQKKLAIQTKINSLQGQERNSANEKEFLDLEKLIAEYKELAKYKLKANNPSKQELGGQNLQTLIQVQIKNYDRLITNAEKYGDATSDVVEKLKEQRDILSKIDSDGKYSATADQYYASRDTYKVESATLSAFEAETRAIEQKTQAVKKLSDELEVYNKQIPNKPANGQRSDYFEGFVQNYKNAIDEAQKYLDNLGDSPVTEEVKKEWERLIEVIEQAKKEMDAVPNADRGSDALSRGKEIDTITKYLNKFTGISKQTKQELKGLLDQLQSGDPSVNVKKIHERFLELTVAERNAGREAKSFFDIFKNKIVYNYAAQLAGYYLSFMDIIRYTRNAVSAIQELDTALVDLKKTTTMTDSELEQFYFDSNDVAKKMGVTTQSIIEQASAWSRLGFNTKEQSTQMAELSSQFAAISPDMDLDTATDGLVSSMKAFDIEVSNVERDIMDNINRIGNTAATSNGEIVDMLTRSSAAMAAANNTIQETIALETAAVEITRNAETTGTAFKTLSMRIRGYDEETEKLSDDLKNISGDIADLTKTASTPSGISLFTDDTKETYKSTYQILKEISDIYDELSDKNRANNYCPYVQKCA